MIHLTSFVQFNISAQLLGVCGPALVEAVAVRYFNFGFLVRELHPSPFSA
jgi:hypothetical protein